MAKGRLIMLETLRQNNSIKDDEFDSIYNPELRKLSKRHFTPYKVAKQVADWLSIYPEKLNIIDLGCGVGKFCFIIKLLSKHKVSGVDFRWNYIDLCRRIRDKYRITDLKFIHKNIIELDLKEYNVLYFFNSFLEQIDVTARLDKNIETSPLLHLEYEMGLKRKLEEMPLNTIVITYHVYSEQIPEGYKLVKTEFESKLKMWIKQ